MDTSFIDDRMKLDKIGRKNGMFNPEVVKKVNNVILNKYTLPKVKYQKRCKDKEKYNELILCQCGCGNYLFKYDSQWRERKHIHKHINKTNEEKKKLESTWFKKGHCSNKGLPRTEEWKRKFVETRRKNNSFICSQITRDIVSKAQKGRKKSLETRKKISEAQKGKILTEEHRLKMSKARKGKYVGEKSPSWKGGFPYCKICNSKLTTRKTKHFICRKCNKRENSPNWLGGKSFELYGLEFNKALKEKIRAKYNYRCQQCFIHQDNLFKKTKFKKTKCNLSVHHIDYNKNNFLDRNLIPLCQSCHIKTNHNREHWMNYFKAKVYKD